MKDQIKRKLRSNQGVTLLLSLLLFLVCAVAGSVALTAGTATSGTISERAKLDQRYFSVTSAAELLRETFDGKSVRVTVTGDTVDVMIKHGDSWIARNHAHTEEKFVIDQSLYFLKDELAAQYDEATLQGTADTWLFQESNPRIYTVSVSATVDTSGLNATVEISRESPGTLNFIVKSAIQREDPEDPPEVKTESKTFSLNVKYNASVLKTEENQNTTYYVKWQIATISYASY
ncbi:MAG: hypothetical protein IKO14_06230 [Oscillibacter sp.]|nr:hypothetical protein [Oscillibacter sp.]